MTKPRVLLIGDHGSPTGFERVVRAIGMALHESGDFEIHGRGVGYDPNDSYFEYPWPVQPVSSDFHGDPVGVLASRTWLPAVNPDCVLMIQDLWQIAGYLGYMPKAMPVVAYYPVDTPNLKWQHAITLGAVARPVVYTHFGASESARAVRAGCRVIGKAQSAVADPFERFELPNADMVFKLRADWTGQSQDTARYSVVPHGLDHAAWGPLDRLACRRAYGLPEDAFIITNVGTNQFRKRQDTTIRMFAQVAARVPNALLVLHCAGGDRAGWDLQQLAQVYGVSDKVVAVHAKRPLLTQEELHMLYNIADININTSGGEGWGLPSFESAACGIPQAVPEWSATAELWAPGEAIRFKVSDYRHEPKGLNTAHAILDVRDGARQLLEFAQDANYRWALSQQALAVAARQRSWESVGAEFVTLVHEALAAPAPAPTRFADWPSYATTPLVDPLAHFDD